MVIVRILKRKDAASVVVAIVVGLVITQLVSSLMSELSNKLAGVDTLRGLGTDWKGGYLQPILYAALQLVLLEILAWIYIWVHDALATSTKK